MHTVPEGILYLSKYFLSLKGLWSAMDVIHRGKPSSGLMVDRSRTLSLSQAFRVQPFFF